MKKTNSKKEWIEDAYGHIREGQSIDCRKNCRCYRNEKQRTPSSWECGLGIKRRDGILIYNCFKPTCELGGGSISGTSFSRFKASVQPEPRTGESDGFDSVSLDLPYGHVPYVTGVGEAWLRSFNITDEEIVKYRIGTVLPEGRLFLPVYDMDGSLKYYQLRRMAQDGTPKYTGTTRLEVPAALSKAEPEVHGVGLICEDLISCIVLGRVAHTAALLGTKLSNRKLATLLKWKRQNKITKIIIVLDSDVTGKERVVDKKNESDTIKLQKGLTPYFDCVIVHEHRGKDPKTWNNQQIRELLNAS